MDPASASYYDHHSSPHALLQVERPATRRVFGVRRSSWPMSHSEGPKARDHATGSCRVHDEGPGRVQSCCVRLPRSHPLECPVLSASCRQVSRLPQPQVRKSHRLPRSHASRSTQGGLAASAVLDTSRIPAIILGVPAHRGLPSRCFGFSMAHFCFALRFATSDICFHISGHRVLRSFVSSQVSSRTVFIRQVAFHSIK